MLLAGEQLVDHLFVSVRRFVVEKRVLLGGRGRNADQVEIDAPQQRVRLSAGPTGPQSLLLVLRGDERVDRIRRFRDTGGTCGRTTGFRTQRSTSLGVSRGLSEQARQRRARAAIQRRPHRQFRNLQGVKPQLVHLFWWAVSQGPTRTTAATTISMTRRRPSSVPIGPSLNWLRAAGFQLSREPSYL